MVLKKCGMAERVVHGCKKKGVDVTTYKKDKRSRGNVCLIS